MRESDRKYWPSWRYGPDGQSGVFKKEEDVPSGWVEHPSMLKGAGDVTSDAMRVAKDEARAAAVVAADAELNKKRVEEQQQALTGSAPMLPREPSPSPAATGSGPVTEADPGTSAVAPVSGPAARVAPEPKEKKSGAVSKVKGSVRRLTGRGKEDDQVEPKPFTTRDDSITLDESRRDAISAIRASGGEIDDNATDGEIEAALNKLDEQE